jgi:hypothetical protein
MNYLDLSEIRQHLGTLKRLTPDDLAICDFEHIKFNGFEIGFYAGGGDASEPQNNFDNLLHYKTIQIGLFETIKESDHTIQPMTDERFRGFLWSSYFIFIDNKGLVQPSYMGFKIPLNDVCQLIKDVYKVSRLKMFY